jgi:hypothetical protein
MYCSCSSFLRNKKEEKNKNKKNKQAITFGFLSKSNFASIDFTNVHQANLINNHFISMQTIA